MNIFWLHPNGRIAALLHADPHVVKMILEIAQMCSNVYYHYTPSHRPAKVYKRTHVRHPMSIWVCQNKAHFLRAIQFGLHLAAEYTHRFDKTHGCESVLRGMLECPPDFTTLPPPEYLDTTVFGTLGDVRVPLCMPECFHNPNACVAYSQYYLHKLLTVPRLRRYRRRTTLALPLAIRTCARCHV